MKGETDSKVNNKMTSQNKKTSIVKGVKFEDIEGKFLLITIGENGNPATEKDLNGLQKKITKEIEKKGINCLVIVANHTVSVQIIEKKDT